VLFETGRGAPANLTVLLKANYTIVGA